MSRQIFGALNIRENVPLAPLTTWRVGGPARFFYEPVGEEYLEVVARAREHGIPIYVLGRGSNVLIDDSGLDGLVICTRRSLQKIEQVGDLIVAEAGVALPTLSKFAAGLGFGGYEFLIGIPGTIGGGVVMNAGLTSQGVREMSDVLESVDVIDDQDNIITLNKDRLGFGYRTSALLDKDFFVIRARFRVETPADREEIRARMARHLAVRRAKQPLSKWTAGSTFKQPPGGCSAGWYIDRAGLKGFQIGGARVSHKHANWIENCGNATARDIKALIEEIQLKVYHRFGVWLEREVRFLPDDRVGACQASGPANRQTEI